MTAATPVSPIRLPSGVRDFLPRAAARRRSLAARVMEVLEAWGYARIITPVFEHADVLERGLGAGARATALRFVEPGTGEVVALRPDITPQIARVVATRLAAVEGPIRLCYEGQVTRLSGTGQREILQAGIELIDAPGPSGDAEVIAIAAAALAATGLPETRLDLGHVAPVQAVLAAAVGEAARARLATALAKKDRIGLRAAAAGLPEAIAPLAVALGSLAGPAEVTLARAAALPWPAEVRAALQDLARVVELVGELAGDAAAATLTIDLGDATGGSAAADGEGSAYYTGIRFAGYATGAPDAVLRGGRYDELVGRYGRSARATGFAIDLELLAQAQRTTGLQAPTGARGVAIYGPQAPTGEAARLARLLRTYGLRAVTATTLPTASWLRGAHLDAAIVLVDATTAELVHATDGARTALALTDTAALVHAVQALKGQP